MLILGIIEASLELVPDDIIEHPAVTAAANARGKSSKHTLLDEGVHSAAMKELDYSTNRGRPDILHRSLLTAFDSILARDNKLNLFVHTLNNEIIEIKSSTRLPRRYIRFVGLMEQLLLMKRIPPKGPALARLYRRSLATQVQRLKTSRTFLLTEKGVPTPPMDLAKQLHAETKPLVLVGGFAHGTVSSTTSQLSDQKVSLYPAPLSTSAVIGVILNSLSILLRLSESRFHQTL